MKKRDIMIYILLPKEGEIDEKANDNHTNDIGIKEVHQGGNDRGHRTWEWTIGNFDFERSINNTWFDDDDDDDDDNDNDDDDDDDDCKMWSSMSAHTKVHLSHDLTFWAAAPNGTMPCRL